MTTNNLQFYASALFLFIVLLLPSSDAEIDCNAITLNMSPCLSYLTNMASSPSQACCAAAGGLAGIAASSSGPDLKAACYCLVSAATKFSVNEAAAQGLAGSCGINLPITISAHVDCSQIGS